MRHSRFSQSPSSLLQTYSESISYDWRLYKHDIDGSIAHARALLKAQILSKEEFSLIENGLRKIEKEIEEGNFEFSFELEDIHMNIEAALTNAIGAAGAKLHTARSRNDQVATDTRLYCREQIEIISGKIIALQEALLQQAEANYAVPVPGYTHLQRGQPVTVGHHLLAYVEMLGRDKERLTDASKRLNLCPLGSGALAGSTINLDREGIAKELGFDGVTTNSMDAISDRDYLAEILFALSLVGAHLSRLSEDLILWCSAEFQFASLSDAHTTGSSLMPQKKNPDICELTRGKTGRLYGNLQNLLTNLKGLPLTYNRDLQEDKEPLFDSMDTVTAALQINAEMIRDMAIHPKNCTEAASDPLLLATDLADWLVLQDIPFREAHDIIGELVAEAAKTNTPINQLELPKIHPAFTPEAVEILQLEKALQARTNIGAPNPNNILEQIKRWKNSLEL